jgi:alcohol dehydrogenase
LVKKILIHGRAGGIGSVAIQLEKNLGAHVATTVSSDDKQFAAALGTDEIIDYRFQAFNDLNRDLDAVFDTVGGENILKVF